MTKKLVQKHIKQFTKVLTFGVFDYFHYGHLKLFEQAKRHGNYLIVAIQKDEWVHKRKPNSILAYNLSQRTEMISALKIVNKVTFYSNVEDDIKTIDFDVFAVGEDQNHDGFKSAIDWCEKNGKTIVHLKRTPGISSTQYKNEENKKSNK